MVGLQTVCVHIWGQSAEWGQVDRAFIPTAAALGAKRRRSSRSLQDRPRCSSVLFSIHIQGVSQGSSVKASGSPRLAHHHQTSSGERNDEIAGQSPSIRHNSTIPHNRTCCCIYLCKHSCICDTRVLPFWRKQKPCRPRHSRSERVGWNGGGGMDPVACRVQRARTPAPGHPIRSKLFSCFLDAAAGRPQSCFCAGVWIFLLGTSRSSPCSTIKAT